MKKGGMPATQRACHSDHLVLHVLCRPTPSEQGSHTHKGVCTMSNEDNKALVCRLFEEVWNQGRMAGIAEFYSPPQSSHTSTAPVQGHEASKQDVIVCRTSS